MRIRRSLVVVVVLAGLLGAASPLDAASELPDAACFKDPKGDQTFAPADIIRVCYRYTADSLILDTHVAKPVDPYTHPQWENGMIALEIYPKTSGPPYGTPLEVYYYRPADEFTVLVRPKVFDEDWKCYGTASTIAEGYRATIPWDCIRVEIEPDGLWYTMNYLLLKDFGDGAPDMVGPPPPPPPPARPAVEIRNADSACPPGEVPEDGLTDADGTTHEAAIDCTMWWGVTTRTSAGHFSPAGKVTRGLMAEWIARFLDRTGGQLPETAEDQFSDIASSPFRDSINRIGAAGVVGGYSDGTFRPTEPVSRAQMATFIASAHRFAAGKALGSTATDWFADDETSVHQESINRIASVGVAGGTSQGIYSPGSDITRGQMASFLSRLLDVAVDDGRATPPA